MKLNKIEDYFKGWIVGSFQPTEHNNPHVEVAVKFFKAGETESPHYQIKATEITIVHQGRILLGEKEFSAGDVITIPPGEIAGFESLTDSSLTCIKFPSLPNDKVVVNE
jgi:quercetin dioxygenase-like cupin family protein